eukprot:11249229-Prorocentrum_lima.AAC.1
MKPSWQMDTMEFSPPSRSCEMVAVWSTSVWMHFSARAELMSQILMVRSEDAVNSRPLDCSAALSASSCSRSLSAPPERPTAMVSFLP